MGLPGYKVPGGNVSLVPVDRMLNLVTKYEAISKLGYNPLSPIVNLGQLVFNVETILKPKWTWNGLSEALKTSAGEGKNLKENIWVLEQAGQRLPESDRLGLINYAKAAQTGKINPLWLFEKSENAQKNVALLGMYWKLRSEGVDQAGALAKARNFMDVTIFNPSKGGNPAYMRGQGLRALFQFKSYAYKEMEFWAGLSTKDKARFMTKLMLIGGPASVPLASYLPGFDDFKLRHPKLSRGALGMAGVDLSDTISPFNMTLSEALKPGGLFTPAIGEIPQLASAYLSGDPVAKRLALRQVMPAQLRRLKDWNQQMGDEMYRRPGTGEAVTPISRGQATGMLFGVRPLELGQISDIKQKVKSDQDQRKIERRQQLEALNQGDELQMMPGEGGYANNRELGRAFLEMQRSGMIPASSGRIAGSSRRMQRDYQEYLDNLESNQAGAEE
jgi:hypothetical protein